MGLIIEQSLPHGTNVVVKHPDGIRIPGKIVGIASQGVIDLYIIEPTPEGLQMIQDQYDFKYTHFAASEGELEIVK